MYIGTTVIEFKEEKKKKNNMDKINFGQKWYLKKVSATQLSFDMCCTVKSLKGREFSNVWGNTNTIAALLYRVQ